MAIAGLALALASPAGAALVGFYSFDDPAAPLADSSGAGRDLLSASADPVYQPAGGVQGGAFFYNGGQRLVAPIDINPGTLPTLTMGAWVKTASLLPGLRKVIGQDDGGWDRTLGLDDREGPFRYTSFIGNGVPMVGGPTPASTNEWTFLAAVYDQPNNTLTLYVDLDASTVGPLSATTVATGFGNGFASVAIGGIRPDLPNEGWFGAIDNVFFFDELLTQAQLTAIRDGGKNRILGIGIDDPNLQVTSTPPLGGLSKVPSVHSFSFEIKNDGLLRTLHLTGVTLSGPDAAYYSVVSFPASLAPGGSGSVVLSIDSRGQVGDFQGTASIQSDDPSNPTINLDLKATVISQALLGFYSFDDDANRLKDDSGNGRTLQNGFEGGVSDPTYLPAGGITGGAFDFAGAQRLAAPLNINPGNVPRLTMGAWVQSTSLTPGLRKILGHDDGAWDRVIGLDTRSIASGGPLPDGTFRYAAFTGLNNQGPSQGSPPPTPTSTTAWTFIAAAYDQVSNVVNLYIDLDTSTVDDLPQVITAAAPMGTGAGAVGIGSITPGVNAESWVGTIDNVFFLSGSVDATTIRAIRDGGKTALQQFRPDPALSVLTSPVFGSLPDSSPRTVNIQIQNSGSAAPLVIAGATILGRDASRYSLGVLPTTIAVGATASIPVTITPGSQGGVFLAMLELTSNDSAGRKRLIDLSAFVPFSTPAAALIAYYPFDEADPLRDASGHGRALSQVAGAEPTFVGDGGFLDGGYDFSGDRRLIAPIDINAGSLPLLTMGAWVKTSVLGGLHKVIGQDDGGWDRVIGMDDREGGLRYTTFVGNAPPLAGTPTPTSIDTWSFIAATYNQLSNRVVMYVDLDASTTNDPLVAVSGPTGFGAGFTTTAIGAIRPDVASEGWSGQIDNVFFYQTVLTAAELTTLRDEAAAQRGQVRILTVQRDAGSLTISWRSASGLFYDIQYKERLEDPWAIISFQGAVGPTTSWTDLDAERLAKRTGFYRVVQE